MDIEAIQTITQLFPQLQQYKQLEQLTALGTLYKEANQQVNLISRKDITNLYTHHVLHSICIALYFSFQKQQSILDVGTGGGFPGLPLAILFPQSSFTLVDSIRKKIEIVRRIAQKIGLENITTLHRRVEDIRGCCYDSILSRSVTSIPTLLLWTSKLLAPPTYQSSGWLFLKGGELTEEIKKTPHQTNVYGLQHTLPISFFKDKYLLHIKR